MSCIEVESELNPRYLETFSMADYFGIYHVIKYSDDKRFGLLMATFDDPFTDRRGDAYRYAGTLLNPPPPDVRATDAKDAT